MKKFLIFTALIAIFALSFSATGCSGKTTPADDCLRLHIRANSNSDYDQNLKLKVRDEIVAFLSPLLTEAENSVEAEKIISDNLSALENVGRKTLADNGESYSVKAEIRTEYFPTKSYGDVVFDGGKYRAVIIELGSGEGDNWWCVAYPPLCFVGEDDGDDPSYKSLIAELINKWRNK